MKARFRRTLLAAVLVLPLALACCAGPGALPEDPKSMRFPPLEVSPPDVERVPLENGTVLFLLPDREVPIVDIRVRIRAGAVFDPDEQVGLAELTGLVMRTGGAGGITPGDLNTRIEEMGAVLESSIGTVWLEGEISNFKAHYSGHMYLSLKDEKSQIRAVMFKPSARASGW